MKPKAPVATRLALLFSLFCSAFVAACSPSATQVLRDVRGPVPEVREVRLVGVTRFSKEELLAYLHIDETDWLPFTRDYFIDPGIVAVDQRRIVELYRAHGYYQARVLAIEPIVDEDGEEADVVIRVEEGKPARVTHLRIVWAPDTPLDAAAKREIEAASSLSLGGPFETVLFNQSLGTLRAELLSRGFPLAKVQGSADVAEGARQADVELRIAPGPHATITSVRFDGLVDVPQYMCDREVAFALGKAFSPGVTNQIEQSLKAMRVFRWVAVVPAETVREGKVDLVVRVSEADPHTITFGPELSVEAVRWQQQLTAQYTYTNLFGNLTRLDLKAVAGYAELPNFWETRQHGPVAKLEPALRKKGILEPSLLWALVPSASVDIQEGYQYWTLGYRAGVTRWFAGMFSAGLSHNLYRVDYFNQSDTFDSQSTALGLDFLDPYLLSYAELQGSAYLVDSIKNPRNGAVFEATYDLAGSIFGGAYDYQKVLLVLRGYYRPWERVQLVSRLQGGTILPYGSNPGAPFANRFYLGGPSVMRGYGSRRLSPKIEDCPDDGGDCKQVPVGGYSMVQGTLEARVQVDERLSVVAFTEAGDVRSESASVVPSGLSFTAGPGLRVDTPLGLVRLDAGFRLNRPAPYEDEAGYSLYLGLGQAL